MSTISLPPRFVMTPAEEVYDRRLDDEHFRTLAQIRGLAYKTKGERTPVLSIEDLVQIRGVDRSTIYRHLASLRQQGYIRTERIGKYQFVIYPLRWELGAALPADGDHEGFTEEEAKGLFGGDGKSRTDATNPENCRTGATHHDVVVHDHDSSDSEGSQEPEQQQHDFSRTDATNFDVSRELVLVFVHNGVGRAEAEEMAAELIQKGTAAACRRQLEAFGRRCAVARASKRGLENPVGLLRKSILEDWPLPETPIPETANRMTHRGQF